MSVHIIYLLTSFQSSNALSKCTARQRNLGAPLEKKGRLSYKFKNGKALLYPRNAVRKCMQSRRRKPKDYGIKYQVDQPNK